MWAEWHEHWEGTSTTLSLLWDAENKGIYHVSVSACHRCTHSPTMDPFGDISFPLLSRWDGGVNKRSNDLVIRGMTPGKKQTGFSIGVGIWSGCCIWSANIELLWDWHAVKGKSELAGFLPTDILVRYSQREREKLRDRWINKKGGGKAGIQSSPQECCWQREFK